MIELLVNGYAVDIPTFMYIWTGAALAGGLLTGLIGGAGKIQRPHAASVRPRPARRRVHRAQPAPHRH